MLTAMARSVKWTVHLSIWGSILAQMASLCLGAGLPPQVKIAMPPAAWIRECTWAPPTNKVADDKSEGTRYLVYERQYNPAEKERFTRIVRLMENATGVQDSGSLSFDFAPEYQELILHRVQIHRNGAVLDRLNAAKIKIIQPEPDLNGDVFTGEQSAVVFVEDLRVGDVLEYAFTLRGANPVFNGHYAAKVSTQSSVPVDRQRVRLIWTLPKPVSIRAESPNVAPKEAPWNGGREYQWDSTNVAAITEEDEVPFEFNPYPSLEFTEFRSWAEVVDWALPLYAVEKTNAPPELEELITKWRAAGSDAEGARMALEFVQDELRYTGIELGPDSYRPTHPFDTFRLRFGDCKGKSSLLCTILREMNIEAYPALVDSGGGMIADGRLPSPFAFDHVIVKIILDGKVAWVDPTASDEGGPLWERHVSHFGNALVIQPGVTALEAIPFPAPDKAQQLVTSEFKLKNYKSPVSLTVKTVYRGAEADRNRDYFARNNRAEIQKNYLNFYSRYYTGITNVASLTVEDTRAANLMIVTEQYQIDDLWTTNTSEKEYEVTFYGETLYHALTDPDVRVRKMPLRIGYPLKYEQDVIVHMPDNEWKLPTVNKSVEDDAFSFQYQRTFADSTVRFHYVCETKTNQVPVAKVAGYLKDRDQMSDLLSTMLYRSFKAAPAPGVNWLMVMVACFGFTGALAGCGWLWWYTGARVPAGTGAGAPPLLADAQLQGLGGWLILVAIGLCVAPFIRIGTLAVAWQGFFSQSTWQLVAVSSGAKYHPLYGPLLIFEVLSNVVLLVVNLFVLCLFFAKRRAFPKFYITFLLASVTCLLLDEILSNMIPSVNEKSSGLSSPVLYRTAFMTFVWCAYMLKSRRVKATFVR
jgi:hypothetical protein